jgi:hypothetical protein
MKKSTAVVASIVLLIVALSGGVAHAQEPTVWLWSGVDGSTFDDVKTTDVIGFIDGWGASTPGLVKMYLKANHTSLVLKNADTGEVLLSVTDEQIAQNYLGLSFGTPEEVWGAGMVCPMPYQWYIVWQYGYGSLPAGRYTLVETWTLDHPVNDALHTCTVDGEPASPPPSLYSAGTVIFTSYIVVS